MVNANVLNRIERKFQKSIDHIITEMHFKQGLSVLKISKQLGVSRDFIYTYAKRFSIQLRSRSEAALRTPENKGVNHWAYGLRKETSDWANRHSTRMKTNNPMNDPKTMKRLTISRAKTFALKQWPQERRFKNILDSFDIPYIAQHPIPPYTIDFYLCGNNLCIEIDSTAKWGKERRLHAQKKDLFLYRLGYDVLRINKILLEDAEAIRKLLITKGVISS